MTPKLPFPRFDSLVHVTADGRWMGGTRYDASAGRLLREMKRAHVARACLVAIADYADNETVLDLTRQHPSRFVPVGSINPAALPGPEQVDRAVADLAERGFAGVKLHPRLNQYDPLDERALAAIAAAGRYQMPLFLCTMFRQRALPTLHVSDVVDRIALSCPNTKIVLLHGGASSLLDLFELVRMHGNLVLDLSLTILRYAGSCLEADIRFVCEKLDQRVAVGSDFPEYVPADAFTHLDALTEGLPSEKMARVAYQNLTDLFAHWPGLPAQADKGVPLHVVSS